MDVFPIRIPCSSDGHSDYDLRHSFLKVKPKDMRWFAYDAVLHSRKEVEFIVYDMRDSYSGGVGREIARLKTTVSPSDTEKVVERQILNIAIARRQAEQEAEEAAVIGRYADEIRNSLEAAQ